MGAQKLLGLHGEEVAVEHRGGFDHVLGERERGQFDGKPARLPDAAFDLFRAGSQMGVAGIDLAPRIDDGDHGLAHEVFVAMAHLERARAVAEGTQIIRAEPAVTAERLGRLAGHGIVPCYAVTEWPAAQARMRASIQSVSGLAAGT